MRKNNKIRFLAVFMVLTMLLGSVPVSAAGESVPWKNCGNLSQSARMMFIQMACRSS